MLADFKSLPPGGDERAAALWIAYLLLNAPRVEDPRPEPRARQLASLVREVADLLLRVQPTSPSPE